MYELLYIIPSPFTEKDLPQIFDQVKKIIESFNGKLLSQENLGNKKLAYPIKRIRRGFYILVYFEMEPQKLKEFNQKLRLTSEILRFLIVKVKKPKLTEKVSPVQQAKTKIESGVEKEEGEVQKEDRSKKINLGTLDEKIDKLLEI